MDLDVWQKIVDDPEAELKVLAARVVKFLEEQSQVRDWVRYHFIMMCWSQIGRLSEELAISRAMAEDINVSDAMAGYYQSTYAGKKQLALIPIRAFREQLDELDSKQPEMLAAEKILRQWIAEKIRNELVCCGIYDTMDDCWKPEPGYEFHRQDAQKCEREIMRGPDYHAICHYGEWAARIAQGNEDDA